MKPKLLSKEELIALRDGCNGLFHKKGYGSLTFHTERHTDIPDFRICNRCHMKNKERIDAHLIAFDEWTKQEYLKQQIAKDIIKQTIEKDNKAVAKGKDIDKKKKSFKIKFGKNVVIVKLEIEPDYQGCGQSWIVSSGIVAKYSVYCKEAIDFVDDYETAKKYYDKLKNKYSYKGKLVG